MQVESPQLTFPDRFCCNCGDTHCAVEIQDTRVTRYFALHGTETTFQLALPVCAGCRKTTRRRPVVFFGGLLVLASFVCGWVAALLLLGTAVSLPLFMEAHWFAIGAGLGLISALLFYRLRRATPPRTSFYQPVRIKQADVRFAGVMGGPGQVVYIKLAFTNPDYLNAFMQANRDAMRAGHLAISQV